MMMIPQLVVLTLARGFGGHKTQAHLPISPSLPPLPSGSGYSGALYAGAPTEVVYGLAGVDAGGDESLSVSAALVTPEHAEPEYFHEWSVTHPREGISYFECPTGFDFRSNTKSCVMVSYSCPTESCPYGAYRDKITKHCVHTDSVAPDRTCPSGFGYFMRGCIRRTHVDPAYTCSPGYSRVGSKCYSMTQVAALIECPEGFIRSQNDFLSVDDVLAARGSIDTHVCKKHVIYPPTFHCPDEFPLILAHEKLIATIPYKENVTMITPGDSSYTLTTTANTTETLIPFYAQPLCQPTVVKATQTCPHPDFVLMTAGSALEKILAVERDISIGQTLHLFGASQYTYLSNMRTNLQNMSESNVICFHMNEIGGSLTCPPSYSLVKLTADASYTGNQVNALCLEVPLAVRALNEKSKASVRKDKRQNDRRQSGRLLSEEPVLEHHALTPILSFGDNKFCEGVKTADILWKSNGPICYDVKIAEPIFQCETGRVVCKWLEGYSSSVSGQCTTVCDISETLQSQPRAQVLCEPGDVPAEKTLVDHKSHEEILSVPVCLREIYTPPTMSCPFGLGEPSAFDFRCNALGISDLILSCPEGYTKVSAEKVEADLLGDRRNSKRHGTASMDTEFLPDVCELLEYAEYQITCPAGYQREKARNTGHACVAEKLTKPSLVCPAGYLPNEDGKANYDLDLSDHQACIKVVEIAPTLLSPNSGLMSDNIEDSKHASRGDVTACILTKTGGLSCGTERKYHGQTDIDAQEKFGVKYQDKYQRKTTRQKI